MKIKVTNITGKATPRHRGRQAGVREATVRFQYEVTVAGETANRADLEKAAARALGLYLAPPPVRAVPPPPPLPPLPPRKQSKPAPRAKPVTPPAAKPVAKKEQ